MATVLDIRGLTKTYASGLTALKPVTLAIEEGEIFALLCGYRVQPLFHRVRNHPEVERCSSMMYFANPNPVRPFRPWRRDASNKDVDIIARAIENPTRYGLPPLPQV